MRISAGYLQGRSTAEIGGMEDTAIIGNPIITPVAHKDESSDAYYLGYQFDVKKPKEILVIVKDKNAIPKLARELAQQGVYFMYIKDHAHLEKDIKFDYSFVVFDTFNSENHAEWPLPFRVLSGSNEHYKEHAICTRLIPVFAEYDRFVEKSKNLHDVKSYVHELRMAVYKCWIAHVRDSAVNDHLFDNRRVKDSRTSSSEPLSNLALVLQVEGNDSGKHKGLVTEIDLAKMVLEHCFNAATRSYLEVFGTQETNEIVARLLILLKLRPRKVNDSIFEAKDSIKNKILKQLNEWAVSASKSNIDLERGDIPKQLGVWGRDKKILNIGRGGLTCDGSAQALGSFAEYLSNVILKQAEVFLSKYEEKIVSLPSGYNASEQLKDDKANDMVIRPNERGNPLPVSICFKRDGGQAASFDWQVTYRRHEEFGATQKPYEEGECYLEPLSGSQNYLNALLDMANRAAGTKGSALEDRDWQMIVKLIESGLSNIWIIDERVKEFAKEHPEVGETFRHIGISASDEDDEVVGRLFKDFIGKESQERDENQNVNDWESENRQESTGAKHQILIIHQGIIDKCLQGVQSPDRVAEFLKFLVEKKLIRYVVITTGRGKPANIPDIARILPFSIIESTLFKKYPEKMLLVDAIMGILPGRKEDL